MTDLPPLPDNFYPTSWMRDMAAVEPSPLDEHRRYDVCYRINPRNWHTITSVPPWLAWSACVTCYRLSRPCRIRDRDTGSTYGTAVAILTCFLIAISGRCGQGTEGGQNGGR